MIRFLLERYRVVGGARISLTANGHAEVSCATADIGTGTYTTMAQLTVGSLGLPLENVTVKLGDSTLPAVGAIGTTCDAVREELLGLAKKVPNSPLADATLEEVTRGRRDHEHAEWLGRCVNRGCDAA